MDKPEALDPQLAQAIVLNAHSNLEKVRELVEQQPKLVNASWDWGGGDWESALGAAAHMGRRDIALYLLEHGARMDLFAAAMLGHVAVVEAALRAFPGVQNVPGPHGIPLIAHATAGGEQATAVLALLESLPSA
ncbi:MAG TPA: ankyrin repeat domain-containing protein [Ktedonobacterales bacterium]